MEGWSEDDLDRTTPILMYESKDESKKNLYCVVASRVGHCVREDRIKIHI